MDLTGKVAVVNDIEQTVAAEAAPSIVAAGGRAGTEMVAVGAAHAAQALGAATVSGQAVGIGGDRLPLWTHPVESVVEFADGAGCDAGAKDR